MTPEREEKFKRLVEELLGSPDLAPEEQAKIDEKWGWLLKQPRISEGG